MKRALWSSIEPDIKTPFYVGAHYSISFSPFNLPFRRYIEGGICMLEMAIQEIIFLISAFTSLLSSEQIHTLSRTKPGDFTRKKGKMQLQRLLLYVIFRNCKDTNSELSRFYASIDRSVERPSRQATHKRLRSLNPDVWPCLSIKFAGLFYKCNHIVRTAKDYLILAADSSAFEMPYSKKRQKNMVIIKAIMSKKNTIWAKS